MFKLGEVVTFVEGTHTGLTGVIWKKPCEENLNHYTVITEGRPYGYWALEEELAVKFAESADKKFQDKEIRDRIYGIKLQNEEYDPYIPVDRDPDEYISEMADINPKYTKNAGLGFKVMIEPNEGPIPHVHVKFKNGNVSYVKIGSADYLNGHESKNHIMNNDERSDLIKFFNAKSTVKTDDGSRFYTSWELAVKMWESFITEDIQQKAFDEAFEYDKDGNRIMPDYTKLPKNK